MYSVYLVRPARLADVKSNNPVSLFIKFTLFFKNIANSIDFSLVFYVNNKTFCNFAPSKAIDMVISNEVKKKIADTPDGVILTIGDFNVPMQYQGALVKALNRLTEQGTLQRLSKGKYYKPRKTIFGTLKPAPEEITKDFLEKNGKLVGYITGNSAFASMGLTTQITSSILIGTNRYRNPLTRGDYVISFLQQRNPITEEYIPLLRILDALKFIKEIPASSPNSIVVQFCNIICALSKAEQKMLLELAANYTPYVRALLGAIMEQNNLETESLKKSLNGTTYYKLPISEQVLPNKKNWNIL